MKNYDKLKSILDNQTISVFEHERILEKGYEEAYQALLAERKKNEQLEVELYEEYDKKLSQMREFMIDKLDQYLETIDVQTLKGRTAKDIFEEATDTREPENNLTEERLRERIMALEAKNIRLSYENAKLNEAVGLTADLVRELKNRKELDTGVIKRGEVSPHLRFTDALRKVMENAHREAERFNHEYIGTEHILMGLTKEFGSVATQVMQALEIDYRKIRLEVEKCVQLGPDLVFMGKLSQTPRAKKVMEYALEESKNMGHNYVSTEHVLLGLARESEGTAAVVLKKLGLNYELIKKKTFELLGMEYAKWYIRNQSESMAIWWYAEPKGWCTNREGATGYPTEASANKKCQELIPLHGECKVIKVLNASDSVSNENSQ